MVSLKQEQFTSSPNTFANPGVAYIFSRTGTTWTEVAKLSASDKVANDSFGWALAIADDASRVIISSYCASPGGITAAGAAYIFS